VQERVVEYHRLVRLVSRAFYQPEEIIVLDGLLHLIEQKDTPSTHTVSDKDLHRLLRLPEKRIASVLTRLQRDKMIRLLPRDEQKGGEEAAAVQPLEHISKRRVFTPRIKAANIWYVDYAQLLKVLKLRRFLLFSSLNVKRDRAEVMYTCPTPLCPNHGQQFSLMDLLASSSMQKGGRGGGFVCDQCEADDGGRLVPTPLVMSGGDQGGETGQEQLKAQFNLQILPISQQMTRVEQLLEEQMTQPDDAADDSGAAQTAQQQLEDGAHDNITVDVSTASSSSPLSLPSAAASSAAVPASGGSRVLHVPQGKGMVAALPWVEGSLRGLEEDRKRDEESRRHEREQEEKRKRKEEQDRYNATFQAELRRMQEAAAAQAAEPAEREGKEDMNTVEAGEEALVEGESSEVMVTVGGRELPLTAVTQADLQEMTEEELAVYEMYAGQGDF
jgi:hypothetical protein